MDAPYEEALNASFGTTEPSEDSSDAIHTEEVEQAHVTREKGTKKIRDKATRVERLEENGSRVSSL